MADRRSFQRSGDNKEQNTRLSDNSGRKDYFRKLSEKIGSLLIKDQQGTKEFEKILKEYTKK